MLGATTPSSLWRAAGGITDERPDAPGAPKGNYKIGFQSITPGRSSRATATIEVNDERGDGSAARAARRSSSSP